MGKVFILYQRFQFCRRFGATWKDGIRLFFLTLDYILSIRFKAKRHQLQSDLKIHTFQVNFNNKNFPIHLRRQDLSMLYEIWMDESYNLKHTSITSGAVLDIGAHVGFTALYYWTQLGDDRQYICIEGSEKNGTILKRNISTIPQSTTYQSIITSNGRQVRFYDEVSGHLHQVHDTLGEVQDSSTINTLLSNIKDNRVALCKIDIEGMEKEVLTKNNQWLSTVSQLYLELHNQDDYVAIKKSLSDLGLNAGIDKGIKHFSRQ